MAEVTLTFHPLLLIVVDKILPYPQAFLAVSAYCFFKMQIMNIWNLAKKLISATVVDVSPKWINDI